MHSDHISTFSLFFPRVYGRGRRVVSRISSPPTPTFIYLFLNQKYELLWVEPIWWIIAKIFNLEIILHPYLVLWGKSRGTEHGSLFISTKWEDLLHKHFERWRCAFARGSQAEARGIHGQLHRWCFTSGFMIPFLACTILFYLYRYSCLCNVQV